MGKETSNLVADILGGVESDLHDDPLVKIEVQEELGVVILDQDLDGLRPGLGSDAFHFLQLYIFKHCIYIADNRLFLSFSLG